MKEKVMYDVNDMIDMLGISRSMAYSLIREAYKKQEPFKVVKIGNLYRIPKRPFDEWAENGNP
ncbi:MAG: helix-turn-helix domain-containing protein [Clostridiales bacterium]|nr:helix-turn-helix domain-containing protein [Clostridiales bacterium]